MGKFLEFLMKIFVFFGIFLLFHSMVYAENTLPKKVAIALPEAATDKGWNQQGATGLKN